ncbi:MAG TPA: helix-turn-helix transcriptional regulator [Xanthobacteraceae bacterium]|nr:helix-turn-helix transcriptional regulator [Xanthobacteraceae bacterium]
MYSRIRRRSDTLTMELRTTAGRWLRELRNQRGLSQRELARQVGAQYTFVSQVESGRCRLPPERYLIWAHALGMTPRQFVGRLLRYYDPVTHHVLVADSEGASAGPASW